MGNRRRQRLLRHPIHKGSFLSLLPYFLLQCIANKLPTASNCRILSARLARGSSGWIYDKLTTWTDAYPWTPTEILTWVSIYLCSTAGHTSNIYTYHSALHDTQYPISLTQSYIGIPLGIADFPKEVLNSPKSWRQGLGPIVSDVAFEKGGHFAAWERTEDLAGQLCRMFGKGGGAERVIKRGPRQRQFKKIVERKAIPGKGKLGERTE